MFGDRYEVKCEEYSSRVTMQLLLNGREVGLFSLPVGTKIDDRNIEEIEQAMERIYERGKRDGYNAVQSQVKAALGIR